MGISMSAKLLYGAEYEELSTLDNLDDMLDEGDLDYASPYYDSDKDSWIVGVQLPRQTAGEAEMVQAIRDAKAEFERLTDGMPGRIIASPHIT